MPNPGKLSIYHLDEIIALHTIIIKTATVGFRLLTWPLLYTVLGDHPGWPGDTGNTLRVHSHWAKVNTKAKAKRIWWVYCTCYNCSDLILFISDVIERGTYNMGLMSKDLCIYLNDIVSVFKCEQHLLDWRNTKLDLNFVAFMFAFA